MPDKCTELELSYGGRTPDGRLLYVTTLKTDSGEVIEDDSAEPLKMAAAELVNYRAFQIQVMSRYGRRFFIHQVDEASEAWEADRGWRRFIGQRIDEISGDLPRFNVP